MPVLVPILPLLDSAIAEPDARMPQGVYHWSASLAPLLETYEELGIEWVQFHDLAGQLRGRPEQSCDVTSIAVQKRMMVSVEGGVRTWQDVRQYLAQAVDLVYLSERDGWHPPWLGIGQREVEARLMFEVTVTEADLQTPEPLLWEWQRLSRNPLIPVLTGALTLTDLARVGNRLGVELGRKVILRPRQVPNLKAWMDGLLLTGGFIQAVMVEHRTLDMLGLEVAVHAAQTA